MKIVVLDGFTLNPGDLSWEDLKSLGACEIYDRTAEKDVVPRAASAEIVLTNKTPVNRGQMQSLPGLKYLGVLATGYNIVDAAAARERHISVTNVPAYGTKSVAQMTLALLLELTQHTGHHAQTVREGRWSRSPDFCYWDHPLVELDGLTLGIVGFGRIGRAVAQLAVAFGMEILVYTPHPPETFLPEGLQFVGLDELFTRSDVVSLHCPLTPQNRELVDARRLGQMKRTAFLLNTSRGPLVDEVALAEALNAGCLAGAGLDVLAVEPPPTNNPLLAARNCLVTPHIAWASQAARSRLMRVAVANVRAFLAGQPVNVVN